MTAISVAEVSAATTVSLAIMLGISVLVLPLLRTRFRFAGWEAGILLSAYLGYLAWVFLR